MLEWKYKLNAWVSWPRGLVGGGWGALKHCASWSKVFDEDHENKLFIQSLSANPRDGARIGVAISQISSLDGKRKGDRNMYLKRASKHGFASVHKMLRTKRKKSETSCDG